MTHQSTVSWCQVPVASTPFPRNEKQRHHRCHSPPMRVVRGESQKPASAGEEVENLECMLENIPATKDNSSTLAISQRKVPSDPAAALPGSHSQRSEPIFKQNCMHRHWSSHWIYKPHGRSRQQTSPGLKKEERGHGLQAGPQQPHAK